MNHLDVLESLDRLVQSQSILCHPFYVAWQRGELTRDQLATYARVYYPHVAAFPRYLESSLAAAVDPITRADLERNLDDERCVPKPHTDLWLDFAEALGSNRETVTLATPHPAAAATVGAFARLSESGLASALAALYAYESQQPEVSRQKKEGLQRHYGVHHPEALAYFDVHATADLHHRQGERDALERCIQAGTSPSVIFDAASEALAAYWQLLDGVCEAAGLSKVC